MTITQEMDIYTIQHCFWTGVHHLHSTNSSWRTAKV